MHTNLGQYRHRMPQKLCGNFFSGIPHESISFFHHGAYEDIPKSRRRIIAYAQEKDIKLSCIFRNLYLEGQPQHKDKSKFITQIIALIRE